MTLACHQQYTFSFEIVFQSHNNDKFSKQLGEPSVHSSSDRNFCNLRSESTFLWMREDNRRRKCPRNLLRQCRLQFKIFFNFCFCFCKSLFRYVARFSFLFFKHSSSLWCSERSLVLGVKAFFTAVSVNFLLFLFSFLLFFAYDLGRFRTSSGVAGCADTFEVDDDLSGGSSKSQKVHSCYWKLLPSQEGQVCLERKLP